MTDPTLSRMIELARGNSEVADVLFSCGEFTRAEIIEYTPQVVAFFEGGAVVDPLRQGVVS